MHAAGGPDAFLEDHAVIVCSDHSQSLVEHEIDLLRRVRGLRRAAAGDARRRGRRDRALPGLALGAGLRARPRAPRRAAAARSSARCSALEGVDLVMRLTGHPDGEAVDPASADGERGELRFAPRGDAVGPARRGAGASRATSPCSGLEERDGVVTPRATRTRSGARGTRCAAAPRATCSSRPRPATSSSTGAAPRHVGGGSHGSLHANDSLGALLWCGTGPTPTRASSGRCATSRPMVDEHFGRRDPADLAVLTGGGGLEPEAPGHAGGRGVVGVDVSDRTPSRPAVSQPVGDRESRLGRVIRGPGAPCRRPRRARPAEPVTRGLGTVPTSRAGPGPQRVARLLRAVGE